MKKPDIAEIKRKIEGLSSLPSIPPVVTKILRLIDTDDVSMKKIGEFIGQDQSISAKVLKIVNSPIYGFPGRISSVHQALMLIGLGAVKGMLLGISIFDMMQKTMLGLWEHSIGSAIVSRTVASHMGLKNADDISVAALIHDIGKVALSMCYPELYREALERAKQREIYITEAEKEVFGITHAQAGRWLTTKWNFPQELVESVAFHHKTASAKQFHRTACIVMLSENIIKMMGFGFSGDPFVHTITDTVWNETGLKIEDLKEVFNTVEQTIKDREALIL